MTDPKSTSQLDTMTRVELQKLALRIAAQQAPSSDSEGGNNRVSEDSQATLALSRAIGQTNFQELELFELPKDFLLTVVMPVFNEKETVSNIIGRVLSTWLPIELLIVDDGSNDGTREVLRQVENASLSEEAHPSSHIRVFYHNVNRGKGAALKTGFLQATGEIVVIQDADQEYDPSDYFELLPLLLNDEADIVYGSRFADESDSSSPGWHRFGNQMITRTSNLFTRQRLTDVETCYKMLRRSTLERIANELRERGFGIELEITGRLARLGDVRFAERPIRYRKRGYAEGKKIGWKDAVWAMWCILRYRAIL